ncbi:chromosome partition protein Smc [Capsulimonas corticalis]|uniref:Chromosome partition protein Smc n=1 Tax=Capsulimonas corticalis TaxID=2219043 RepID=A0A402CUI9_9BACT|nr:chromosome segregation protein SMC [Capsulimonas corticalis]BDI28977.1 chromosome partition protein Smc [Capsulimonas corticalis]
MHLKRLQLQGFKTFADKTLIEFSEGVTAVVGPNGSGKSNIADAILWVLGEQKASAVRGTRATDVIFSGSDKRRPMGMAEVSLTVDNSDGGLPVKFDEVTITRRAYRTGDGEYFLNKVPCRLKDIYELFLDTGVGREAYSLVNQSEIDAVLSVNPEDRRGLFEEAAGIKKYRVKKREAMRKLESTETNLQRVRDIIGEIDGRLEPLREQAERAAIYIKLKTRLRAIETNLLIVDLRWAENELAATRKARAAAQAKLAEQDAGNTQAQERSQVIGARLAEAERELETRRDEHQRALSQAERAESQRALAGQRAKGLESSLHLLAQELEGLLSRRTRLSTELDEIRKELEAAQETEKALRAQVGSQQGAGQGLTERIQQLTKQSERRRQESLALARQQAARQADLARAEARVAELESGLPTLKEEWERHAENARLRVAEVEASREAVTTTRAALAEADKAVADAQAARDAARLAVHTAQNALNGAQSKSVGVSTRLRTLQDLENAQEGYHQGVRAVADARKRGHLQGNFTVVADAFVAPPGYEVAFETALAGSLQDIITDSEADAKAAIDYLYQNRAGRATFLPLNRMRPHRDGLELGRAAAMPGVLGTALELVEFQPRYRAALETLMGRFFICETMDHALAASHVARGWNRIVTLTGELISPNGAMSGGRQNGRGAGQILGRKTEIAGLKADLAASEKELSARRDDVKAAEAAREAADRGLSEAQNARQAAQLAASEASRRVDFAGNEAKRSADQRDASARRMETSQSSLAQARAQAAAAAEALASAGVETAGVDDAMATETEEIRALTAERDALQGDLTAVRINLATESERVASLSRSLRAAQSELDQISVQHERKTNQSREAHAEHASLEGQTGDRDAESAEAVKARDIAKVRLEEQQVVREELRRQAGALGQEMRAQDAARAETAEILHKAELKEARLEVQRGQYAGRLLEEYEIDAEQAMAMPEDPEVTDGSPQEVGRLRREIKAMGEVNTAAVEEYEEVSTRHAFLTEQRADLDEGREKLLEAIREIDESTRGVFLETFHAVAKAFDELFTRLFRGGKTDLVLTNPADILETGIDIMVQPPGKKRQNLALLSGGERALTAAALLFAFLQVKPSPFVVMDEVDAPLDGANVERFSELLREFGVRSQFIIITHNPTTMEAAPLWYGVTMQEPGISRVLSMQAPPGLEDGPAAPANLKPKTSNGRRPKVAAEAAG